MRRLRDHRLRVGGSPVDASPADDRPGTSVQRPQGPEPVPTYLDSWLRRYDVVWAAAGHPAAVFSTTCDELATMTGAPEIEVE